MKKKNRKVNPTSVRLEPELLDDLDERCNELGCSRNDFIRSSVEYSVYEVDSIESDEEESKKPQGIKVEEIKEFECKNGNLYENGSLFGSCSNYDLDQGKVYEKNGKYLGQIKNDSKPQLVEIPHATIEIIE